MMHSEFVKRETITVKNRSHFTSPLFRLHEFTIH